MQSKSATALTRWRVCEWNHSKYTVLHSFNKPSISKQHLLCCPILDLPFEDKSKLFCTLTRAFEVKSTVQGNRKDLCVSVSLFLLCSSYSRQFSILLLLPYDTYLTSHDPWIIYNHTTSPDESARRALWVRYSMVRCRGTKDDEEEESVQIPCKGLRFLALCVCVSVHLLATETVTARNRRGFETADSST